MIRYLVKPNPFPTRGLAPARGRRPMKTHEIQTLAIFWEMGHSTFIIELDRRHEIQAEFSASK